MERPPRRPLRVAFPVVHIETDFESPLAHGDLVTVDLEAERVGEHSVTLHFRVFRPGARDPAASSRVVVCAVEVPSWKKVPVPERVRRAFERHLAPPARPRERG